MAINGFSRKEHVVKNGEGLGEEMESRVGSDESIEEVGGATSGEGEDGGGLRELGAGGRRL
uniref:Uncharacterized protein n=1 Tax=Cucumis melo TaxID=3656 RepID=A0A9I9DPK3_CUCME